MYRFIDHTADAAVEIVAATREELLSEAARALADLLVDDAASLEAETSFAVEIAAEDMESLLVDFLNELIFRFDRDAMLPAHARAEMLEVVPDEARARVEIGGVAYDRDRHSIRTEVKAATFHDMRIEDTPAGFRTVVVFDL